MLIPLGTGDWGSVDENVPAFQMRNMYIVEHPLSPDGLTRISRPTLSQFSSAGSGPIYGIWRQESTFNGDWVVVSGASLYRVTQEGVATLVGSVPGEGFVQTAGTSDRVITVRDGVAYSTDGTTITTVVMPDTLPVGSVTVINGYFVLSVKDSQLFYWINPGETDPDALSFASAERNPDSIVSVNAISDELWFIGASGPEVWAPTGDADAPFLRISGRVYSEGCSSRDSVVSASFNGMPCLIWVTDHRAVVLAQGSTSKISNPSVEETLKSATNLRAWSFRLNRSDFYVLTFNEGTLVFDLIQGKWYKWDSTGFDNWRAHLGAQAGTTVVCGDISDGTLWSLDYGYTDSGNPVVRVVSGFVGNTGKPTPCSNITVKTNVGYAESFGQEPIIEMRWSDDAGNTWSDYYSETLGDVGDFSKTVVFRSLGQIKYPGRVFEFRVSDPIRFRIDYASMNE